jgi:thiol-disulfide isomerase/thioredoxin
LSSSFEERGASGEERDGARRREGEAPAEPPRTSDGQEPRPSGYGAGQEPVPAETSGGAFWVLIGMLVLAASILWAIQSGRPKPPNAFAGQSLPPLHVAGWLNTDKPLAAADMRGKVVLIDYWATWCGPCLRGIPELIAFNKRYRDAGVLVIGLTSESGAAAQTVKNLVETQSGMTWPIGYGAGLTMQMVGIEGLPTYMLFDRSGTCVWGGHSLTGVEAATIEALAKKD